MKQTTLKDDLHILSKQIEGLEARAALLLTRPDTKMEKRLVCGHLMDAVRSIDRYMEKL